jgi:hypothetical protein
MSKTRAEIVNGHQMTILDCISVQSKIRAKTGRGDLERLGEVQAIEPGLLDQELVRAKCVRQRVALHTLVENVVASINTTIFSFFFLSPALTFIGLLLNLGC